MIRNVPGFTLFMFSRLIDVTYNGVQCYFWAGSSAQPNYARMYYSLIDQTYRYVQVGGRRLDEETHRYFKPGYNALDGSTCFFKAAINYQVGNMQIKPSIRANEVSGGTLQSTGYTSDTDTDTIIIGNSIALDKPADIYVVRVLAYNRILDAGEYLTLKQYVKDEYFNKTKTVGVGADFEHWGKVSDWLNNSTKYGLELLGNIVFNQISDLSNGARTTYYTIYQDGSGLNENVDDLTDKVVVECNGNRFKTFTMVDCLVMTFSVASADIRVFNVHDLVIVVGENGSGTGILLGGSGLTSKIYHIFIYCLNQTNTFWGINRTGNESDVFSVESCLLVNLHTGSAGNESGNPTAIGGKFYKNIMFFNCGFGYQTNTSGFAICTKGVSDNEIIFENIALIRDDGIVGRDINYYGIRKKFINCATSDATTFADLAASYPANIIDCIDAIPATELMSTMVGHRKFCRPEIVEGVGLYNGGIDPEIADKDYAGRNYGKDGVWPIGPFQYNSFKTRGLFPIF
ncbi:MAG: hypothetical protein WC898_02440 [Candidatus Paceibacterota bacterium]|jgi:hypothetical protein